MSGAGAMTAPAPPAALAANGRPPVSSYFSLLAILSSQLSFQATSFCRCD
jgi:hypothetical protein